MKLNFRFLVLAAVLFCVGCTNRPAKYDIGDWVFFHNGKIDETTKLSELELGVVVGFSSGIPRRYTIHCHGTDTLHLDEEIQLFKRMPNSSTSPEVLLDLMRNGKLNQNNNEEKPAERETTDDNQFIPSIDFVPSIEKTYWR